MKIVMLAALAAALAAPACATEQVAFTQHMPPAPQHHTGPPPSTHVSPWVHHERTVVPEYRQRTYRERRGIERRSIVRRGYRGGYGVYGNGAYGLYGNGGYGGEIVEGQTRFHAWSHVHRETNRAWWHERHRVVHGACNCGCCCSDATAWLGAEPPETVVEDSPVEETDDSISYVPSGFHIVHE